ncbi:helix-turn-helix domain-containing protein [Leucobacter sp. cx-42]|uniref:PucR family transcriptional regulator n=1 Tax=unclassified Leucobacter TaxID=2621730 RepID=UPI00165D3670|nr:MULTISPECIES: helix-turn-helix domain-containing protein [unclassified Leucobacter]MBC9954126.1 helix-turn-helix domain-containing protein [Leucobacter sp. cx-42]
MNTGVPPICALSHANEAHEAYDAREPHEPYDAPDAHESPDGSGPDTPSLLLSELIEHLGRHTVTPLGRVDPTGRVLGTEFYDALDELTDAPGGLLIVPSGTHFDASHLAELAAAIADLDYCAIAMKCLDEHEPVLAAIAETAGIPILRVAPRVSWGLFEALVGRLLGEQRRSEDAHFDRGAEPLFALANSLAGLFGGSVAIEDLGRRIIAYSSVPGQAIDSLRTRGILARRVPASPFNEDQYRTVIRSEEPIKYPQLDDELPRVAYAIRAGALPLGTIWAIYDSEVDHLTPEQVERVKSAGAIAAAHMLDDIRVREAGQIPREERFRTLLSGTDVTGTEFTELGIPDERGAQLLAFSLGENDHPATLAQLRSSLQRQLSLLHPESVAVARRGRVYAIIADAPYEQVRRLVDPLVPMFDRLIGPGITIALPGRAQRPNEIARLREQADVLFETAGRLGGADRILTVAQLRPQLVLDRVAGLMAQESATLVDPRLSSLAAEHPQLAEAVLHWCQAFGNITRAARELGVHENTVRHRLRRAEEIAELPLGDPDMLLVTWLQLRALP